MAASRRCSSSILGVLLVLLVGTGDAQGFATHEVAILLPASDARGVETAQDCPETFYENVTENISPRCIFDTTDFMQLAAAGSIAVDDFNARDGRFNPTFAELGACKLNLTTTIYDSGLSPSSAVKSLLEMLKHDGERTLRGLVGSAASAVSIPTALVTSSLQIPQISYWSTSHKLDNDIEYPYFMRTIPTDDAAAFATCSYWVSAGYKYASMIYIDDAYGNAYKQAVLRNCLEMGMTKVTSHPFTPTDTRGVQDAVRDMKEGSINVFLLVTVTTGFSEIMTEAFEQDIIGKGKAWFFSDGITNDMITALHSPDIYRALSGSLRILAAGGTSRNPFWQTFASAWTTRDVAALNARLPHFWRAPVNFFEETDGNSPLNANVGAYMYDAVATMGIFFCAIADEVSGELPNDYGSQFISLRETLLFQSISGKVSFDSVGNRNPSTANFEMSNVVLLDPDLGAEPGTAPPQIMWRLVGEWNKTSNQWDINDGLVNQGDNRQPIVDLIRGEHDFLRPAVDLRTTCYLMLAISWSVALFFLGWAVRNRKSAVVRASQFKFLCLIILGTMTSSSSIIPLNIDDSGAPADSFDWSTDTELALDGGFGVANFACQLSIALYSLGFILVYAALASKLYRVRNLFNQYTKGKKVEVSSIQLVALICACLGFDAIVMFVWFFGSDSYRFAREVLARDINNFPTQSSGKCVSNHLTTFVTILAVFHAFLLIIGNYLAFRTRNVATAFAEGKYIAVAMFANLQVLALGIPVLVMAADNPSSTAFLRCATVFLNDLSILCILFIPKILATNTTYSSSLFNNIETRMGAASDVLSSDNGKEVVDSDAPRSSSIYPVGQ